MKRSLWILVFTIAIVPAALAAGQGKYLVRLDDRLPVPAATMAKKLGRAHGVEVTHVYSSIFNGFAFTGSPKAARDISRSRYVSRVEAAPEFRVMYTTQTPIPAEGLDRVDERAGAFGPLDNAYTYNETGYGSVIYVLDTGVSPVPELAGRIIGNTSYVPNDPTTTDCGLNGGHGTMVATVAAGSTHGVAKQASIVNMKVIRCASKNPGAIRDVGDGADILAALNDVANSHNPNERSIVNLSLAYNDASMPGWCIDIPGCNYRNLIADAANNLVTRGITVVTAVPNAGQPYPCQAEPAARGGNVGGMISVSYSSIGDTLDPAAGTGVCVDIFGPTPILASGAQGDEVSFGNSSAATALVSGVSALIQERQPSIATNPGAIETQIKNNSSQGVLVGQLNGSPNRVVHSLPSVTLTMPTSVIQNQTFTASTPVVSGATYQWKVANGTILSGQGTPSVSIRAGVCWQYRTMAAVTVTAGATKSSGFAVAQIPKPTAYVYGNAWISAGQSADIYANLTGTGPWTVSWSDGFTQTVTSSPAVHTVSPTETTYYAIDWVQDAGGCYGTKSGYASVFVE